MTESTRSSNRDRSARRPDWDEVTDVIERCRAFWVLSEVPKMAADDMASELETHLREHLAGGGTIEQVVGKDLSVFAGDWAAQRRSSSPLRIRTPRALSAPLSALATYTVVAHIVALIGGNGVVLAIRISDLLWLGLLLTITTLVISPRTLRAVLLRRDRAPALLAALTALSVPVAVPLAARTVASFGPTLFGLGWPWTVLFVLAAAMTTFLASPRFLPRHTAPGASGPPTAHLDP